MKTKSIYFTITVVLIVSAMVLAYIYPFAKSEPIPAGNNDTVVRSTQAFNNNSNKKITVSSAEDLRKISLLGGTNSELALEENPGLGIAKEFSIFAEGDVTFTGADTEGKVAAGGGVYGQATKIVNGETIPYQYQIGMNNSDEYSADVIVGDGPVEGIALDYGYTDDGRTRTEDNKLIAYSSTASKMNLDDYTDEEKEHFTEADLIDFKSEFERLRRYSQELANSEKAVEKLDGNFAVVGNLASDMDRISKANSELEKYDVSRRGIETYDRVYVFKGNNEDLNIFNMSANEFDFSFLRNKGIVFDIPYGSKAVLNITGDIDYFEIDYGNRFNIYYPLSEEKLAEINVDNQKIGYIVDYTKTVTLDNCAEYLRDDKDNVKPFIRIAGGEANGGNIEDLSENILINIPEIENFYLYDCGATILAPNSNVITELGNKSYQNSEAHNKKNGYLLGTLICKSYNGCLQFGSTKKKLTRKYRVNVNKVDEQLQENIKGAEFELYDAEGNKVKSWTSSENTENIELNVGTYTIKETKAPDGYEGLTEDIVFTVESDGRVIDKSGKQITIAEVFFNEEFKEKTYVEYSADWENRNQYEYNIYPAYNYIAPEDGIEIDWDSINSNVENNVYNTQDGGKIVVESSQEDLIIPETETSSGKEIKYEIKDKSIRSYSSTWQVDTRNTIIKYNSENKVEWVSNIQSCSDIFNIGNIIETDDVYLIAGGMGSDVMYIDGSQTANGEEFEASVFRKTDSLIYSFVLSIDKNGNIDYAKKFDYNTINGVLDKSTLKLNKYKQRYSDTNFTEFVVQDFVVKSGDKIARISIRPFDFPYKWDALYNGLNTNVGNVTKISFEIDTSNSTKYTDENLYMIVAENNALVQNNDGSLPISNNWVEFVKYKYVENGDKITTQVPYVKDFYPYLNKSNLEYNIVKFKPYFYRQANLDSEAKEVDDVNVKNIKVYWKEVNYNTKLKTTSVSVAESEPLTISNKKIRKYCNIRSR